MIQILIIEDNSLKAQKIGNLLSSISGCTISLAPDLVSARKHLFSYFDLVILDLNLPERFDEDPKENNGIEFIKEIKKSKRLKLPHQIVGLTQYSDLKEKYQQDFDNALFSLIEYDPQGNDWEEKLRDKVLYLIKSEDHSSSQTEYEYDIALISALRAPELDAILNLNYGWEKFKVSNDSSYYFKGTVSSAEKKFSIVATSLPQMGMTASAVSSMKVINNFKPKYLFMTGICGGMRDKVNLGDIVICDLSFDCGSGKLIQNADGKELFEPDFKALPLSGTLKEELQELSTNQSLLRNLRDKWKGNKPTTELRLHVGPMASGSAVIANDTYMKKITTHQRKLLAIDMETYSIFYASEYGPNPRPTPISIKVVSDYADPLKNDDFQLYASYLSAGIADYIINNTLSDL